MNKKFTWLLSRLDRTTGTPASEETDILESRGILESNGTSEEKGI